MSEEIQDAQIPRVDELDERQIERLSRNHLLVSLVDGGVPLREALKRVATHYPHIPLSARSAQKLLRRFRERGYSALLDRRCKNRRGVLLFTKEVQDITLAFWFARPAAGPRAIWKLVVEQCREKGLPAVRYDVIKKFLATRPQHEKLLRGGRIEVWDKQARPVVRFNWTTYANERWQIDHCQLPIWVRELVQVMRQKRLESIWMPQRVWLTIIIDVHSRAIAGVYLSVKTPDAWTTSITLRYAILPKQNPAWRNRGLPSVLQPDRGADFMSHAVAASISFLGIRLDPDPPYYPQRKGIIERFNRTLNTGCLRALPCHHAEVGLTTSAAEKHLARMLTRRQLLAEIERFITTDYHMREHSETGRRPAELWEEAVRLRMPESEEALDAMLLKADRVRRVRHTGVDFHIPGRSEMEQRGGRYWSPELTYHWGRQVQVRYNPEDLSSILVYADAGEFIGEAWRMGDEDSRYDIGDIKRNRSEFRRGLLERQREYAEEIHKLDRRAARQAEWDEARRLADAQAEAVADDSAEEPSSDDLDGVDEVERMLARFERRDRGEL